MIEVKGLRKSFNGVEVLRGVDFTARDGQITGLIGPNGAGKTTTMRMLYTVLRPDSGSALVDGYDPTIGTGDTGYTWLNADGGTGYVEITLAGTNGYTISQIDTYSGFHQGGRHWYDYDLSYATVSAPTTWIPLYTSDLTVAEDGGQTWYTNRFHLDSAVTAPGDAISSAAVIALRWDIRTAGIGYGTVWREFDVFGTEAAPASDPIPEPAALGLLGVALLGLRRRRS